MEHKTLPIFNALIFGFRWALDKFSLFFQILLVYVAILLGGFLLGTFLWVAVKDSEYGFLFGLILALISAFILLVIDVGFVKVSLDVHDTGTAQVETLFAYFKRAGSAILLQLLYILGVLIGLALLIIPGVIFAIRSIFAYYFFVDKNMGVIDSFKESFRITKGYTLSLLPIVILFVLLPSQFDLTSPLKSVYKLVGKLDLIGRLDLSIIRNLVDIVAYYANFLSLFAFLFFPVMYLALAYLYRFLRDRSSVEDEFDTIIFEREVTIK